MRDGTRLSCWTAEEVWDHFDDHAQFWISHLCNSGCELGFVPKQFDCYKNQQDSTNAVQIHPIKRTKFIPTFCGFSMTKCITQDPSILCGFFRWKLILFTPQSALLSAHSRWPLRTLFRHNCLWLRCLRFFCWSDKYKDFSSSANRVVMTRNSTAKHTEQLRKSRKNWFVLWSTVRWVQSDMRNPFFAKCSFRLSEGVSNLKLATGLAAFFSGKIKSRLDFLLHYLALFYVPCKWDHHPSKKNPLREHFCRDIRKREAGIIVKSLNYFSCSKLQGWSRGEPEVCLSNE